MKLEIKDKKAGVHQKESCEGALIFTHYGDTICCKTVGTFDETIALEYLDAILDGTIASLLGCVSNDTLAAYLFKRRAASQPATKHAPTHAVNMSAPGGLEVILSSILNDMLKKGGTH